MKCFIRLLIVILITFVDFKLCLNKDFTLVSLFFLSIGGLGLARVSIIQSVCQQINSDERAVVIPLTITGSVITL